MDYTLISLLIYALLLLTVGYFLPFTNKIFGRYTAWLAAIITLIFSTWITIEETPLYRMIAIVYLQLLSMKVLVVNETYSGRNKLTFFQWSAFALGWFGMRPALFEKLPSSPLFTRDLLLKGVSRILIGLLLIYASTLVTAHHIRLFFFPELLLLAGLSFILHFGILNISTSLWRLLGVDVRELFRSPYQSTSLKEFWGKRWNVAFTEMTALVAYRPLKNRMNADMAMILSFLLSGALHEIAISFPVKGGYGLPLLYFAIHGTLMYAEGRLLVIKKIINHKVLSHIWVMGWLVVPMPLLFHSKFIELVLKPLRYSLLHWLY